MRNLRPFALTVILLAVAVTGCGGDENADEAFTALAGNYLEAMLPMNPEWATNLGDHRYDGEVSDRTEDGYEARVKFAESYLDSLGDIDPDRLSVENRIDYEVLIHAMDATRGSEDTPLLPECILSSGVA